jgi:hypothetical protein
MNAIATLNAAASNFSKQRMFHTLTDWMINQINDSTSIRAIVNGVLGDYLSASQHPLAIQMHLRMKGLPLPMDEPILCSKYPHKSHKIIVLVHGLCMSDVPWSEKLLQHQQKATVDHYSIMGYTPVFLRYNSGCHISTNGQEFAELLESMVTLWPIPVQELVIVSLSMGGLVSRSACHYGALASHHWLQYLTKMVFIGTPHHGSPLERGGNWVDCLLSANNFTAPLARFGKVRSAGITDLRYGNLLDRDWQGCDRFESLDDHRRHVALPDGVLCYAIAVTYGKRTGDLGDRIFGDGLVPLNSALGYHDDPARCLLFAPSKQWVGYRMSHLDLFGHPNIYAQIKTWLTA